jgi:hypothetical protein
LARAADLAINHGVVRHLRKRLDDPGYRVPKSLSFRDVLAFQQEMSFQCETDRIGGSLRMSLIMSHLRERSAGLQFARMVCEGQSMNLKRILVPVDS